MTTSLDRDELKVRRHVILNGVPCPLKTFSSQVFCLPRMPVFLYWKPELAGPFFGSPVRYASVRVTTVDENAVLLCERFVQRTEVPTDLKWSPIVLHPLCPGLDVQGLCNGFLRQPFRSGRHSPARVVVQPPGQIFLPSELGVADQGCAVCLSAPKFQSRTFLSDFFCDF